MSAPPSTVRLRRGPVARMTGGAWFQGLLGLLVGAEVLGLAVATSQGYVSWPALTLLALIYPLIWAFGVSAWAVADAHGVRWRYFLRRCLPWAAMQEIRFTTAQRTSSAIPGIRRRPAVKIVSAGRTRTVVPIVDVADRDRIDFALALEALAAGHGVRCVVDDVPWSSNWETLRTAQNGDGGR